MGSSTNRSPKYFESGSLGKKISVWLCLKIVADIGVIGLPNSGKSTFLSYISNAKPKIGNYPFTTLYPNLGTVNIFNGTFVIADIPGLIQGSSKGLGMGIKFLNHVE